MTERVTLVPGSVPLSALRAIYFGADVALDLSCRSAVEASAETIAAIVAKGEPVYGVTTGFGKLAGVRIATNDLATLQRNLVLSHAAGVGEPLPVAVVRLVMALKLASLAQGASGVRWPTVELLAACLSRGLLPVIPGQGSAAASGDLAPLAHMTAALMGVGAFMVDGEETPAAQALQEADLEPLTLGAKEGLALLNGTQVSTALALAGLFEAERVFRAALVTGALTTDAVRGSDGPFDPRIHDLRRHRGQKEVAAALRALMAGSAIRASHLTGDDRMQAPLPCASRPPAGRRARPCWMSSASSRSPSAGGEQRSRRPARLRAGRQSNLPAATTTSRPSTRSSPIRWPWPLCGCGLLAGERRIALLVDPGLSALPPFLTPIQLIGFMIPHDAPRSYPRSSDEPMPQHGSIRPSPTRRIHVSMASPTRAQPAPSDGPGCPAIFIGIKLLRSSTAATSTPLRIGEALERGAGAPRATVPISTTTTSRAEHRSARPIVTSGGVAGC